MTTDPSPGSELNFRILLLAVLLLAPAPIAQGCLRAQPDKRAIQWSDTIVRATLRATSATTRSASDPGDEFQVIEVIEGKLKAGDAVVTAPVRGSVKPSPCEGILFADEKSKLFLLLLRTGPDGSYAIVTVAPVDAADPTARVAFNQLLQETRKDEAALTDDQVRSTAVTLANAQDDTEAEHAERTLLQMGARAGAEIVRVMATLPDAEKKRLQKVLDEIMPPSKTKADPTTTTQPRQ